MFGGGGGGEICRCLFKIGVNAISGVLACSLISYITLKYMICGLSHCVDEVVC